MSERYWIRRRTGSHPGKQWQVWERGARAPYPDRPLATVATLLAAREWIRERESAEIRERMER